MSHALSLVSLLLDHISTLVKDRNRQHDVELSGSGFIYVTLAVTRMRIYTLIHKHMHMSDIVHQTQAVVWSQLCPAADVSQVCFISFSRYEYLVVRAKTSHVITYYTTLLSDDVVLENMWPKGTLQKRH